MMPGAFAAADRAGEPGSFSHPPMRLAAGALYVDSTAGAEAPVDPVAYCLSCHEEETAGADGTETGHPAPSAGLDHPVDVRYPESDREYRPPGELAPVILLLDRRVTCLSCHAYDDPGHAPVLAIERSELCLACHLD